MCLLAKFRPVIMQLVSRSFILVGKMEERGILKCLNGMKKRERDRETRNISITGEKALYSRLQLCAQNERGFFVREHITTKQELQFKYVFVWEHISYPRRPMSTYRITEMHMIIQTMYKNSYYLSEEQAKTLNMQADFKVKPRNYKDRQTQRLD